MNFKTTCILFGVLIALLLAFGIAVQIPRSTTEKAALFPAISQDFSLAIETVVLDQQGKEIRLVKTGRGWRLREPPGTAQARADEGKVDQIIEQVRTARKIEGAVVSRDLAKVGLERPTLKVVLKEKGAGREWTLNVGNKSEDKLLVYVTTGDRPHDVAAVTATSLDSLFFDSPAALRARTLLDVTESNADAVRLTEPAAKEKREVALAKSSDGLLWLFKVPSYFGPADFAGAPPPRDKEEPGVKGLLNSLAGLRVEEVKDFEPLGSRPLDHYDLTGGKETLRVEVEHTGGPLRGGKDKTVKQVLLVGSKVKDQYYVRLEDDDSVARVGAAKLETAFLVLKRPEILRSRDLTQIERSAVDVVDVRWGSDPKQKKEMQLFKVDPTRWELFADGAWDKANETAVAGDRDSLLSDLKAQGKIGPGDYFDAPDEKIQGKELDAKLGFDHPVAEVKLYVGGVAAKPAKKESDKKASGKDKDAKDKKEPPVRPELKKDAKPAVTLLFGKTDKDRVYVKSVSDKLPVTRVSVPVAVLEKLTPPEGALAFLDTALPDFSPFDVVKLELDRGAGGKLVVARPDEPAKKDEKGKVKAAEKAKKDKGPEWLLVEPKDLPGRDAADASQVAQVLTTLANLKVEKWVRRVDPKQPKSIPAEYGLEPPALTATVTLKKDKDKTETIVYKFGKEGGDEKAKGVYALQSRKDIVFLAQPTAVKVLRETELRDRTIFALDPSRIKELGVTVWLEKGSFNVTLLLEYKSGDTWAAAKPAGFDLDTRKAADFARKLSTLKAERFVLFKGKIPADYKLGADDKNLKIEIKVEEAKDDKKPKEEIKTYSLTVGALNEDKTGYYATASTLPGAVFLAPREVFEPVVGGISHFSRTKQVAAK
jgi:hypothetical protein